MVFLCQVLFFSPRVFAEPLCHHPRMWLVSLNLVALVISLSTLGRRASCAPLHDLRDQLRGTVLNITRPVPSPVPPAVLTVLPEVAQPEAVTQPPVQPSVVIQPQPAPAPQAPSLLDATDCGGSAGRFVVEPCAELMADAAHRFDEIYARQSWGSRVQELGTHTRSGLGSDMKGAFDWITGLTKFFNQNPEPLGVDSGLEW